MLKGTISQEIMDTTMERIARESDLLDKLDIPRNQHQHLNNSTRTITILPADPNMKLPSPLEFPIPTTPSVPTTENISKLCSRELAALNYISLTKLARSHHMNSPRDTIQCWMSSDNTLAFLDLWERENNPSYDASAYDALLEMEKFTSTITAKQWIEKTKAIGIVPKRGGTYAHLIIAGQFATWLSPQYMMQILKMAELEDDFFKENM